jgi:hypothetical protein
MKRRARGCTLCIYTELHYITVQGLYLLYLMNVAILSILLYIDRFENYGISTLRIRRNKRLLIYLVYINPRLRRRDVVDVQ